MTKYWWIFLIAILALAAAAAYFFFYRKKPLEFDFDLGGDLSTLLGLVTRTAQRSGDKIGGYIDIPLTTTIKNPNKAVAALQNISGNISYDGENIIQTKPGSASLQNVRIAGKGSQMVSDIVQLMINSGTIKLIDELIKGKNPQVNYNFSATIMGRPVNFSSIAPIKSN